MTEIQSWFYNYIKERVIKDKEQVADDLLKKTFEKQDQDKFDLEYFKETRPQYMKLIKEEYIKEVNEVMNDFEARLILNEV